MIDPKELRIGNVVEYFHDENGFIDMCVDLELLSLIAHNDQHPEYEFEPIPLTEEWLLKFGFKITAIADYVHIDFTEYTLGRFRVDDANNVFFDDEEIRTVYDLKYVHQLQNLYFALKGEELTIKETAQK